MVAFNVGFNFRATLGFVTDPPGTLPLYSSGNSYPVTSGGVTYGRESGAVSQYRDRNASIDPRLAGIHAANDGGQVTYRVDLVQTGVHEIRGAFGDASFGAGDVLVEFIDGTTVFATIDKLGESISAGQWYDATGVVRSPASDWVSNNEPIQHDFATQIFRVRIARPSGPGGQTKIAHLQVTFVGGGSTPETYTYEATGGVSYGGAATPARTKAPPVSGGIVYGGAAVLARTRAYAPAGGIVFAGSADTVNNPEPNTYTYTGDGGIVYGGAAPSARSKAFTPAGGLTFSGAATLARGKAYMPQGGLLWSGETALARVKDYIASGGLSFGGIAPTDGPGEKPFVLPPGVRKLVSPGRLVNP